MSDTGSDAGGGGQFLALTTALGAGALQPVSFHAEIDQRAVFGYGRGDLRPGDDRSRISFCFSPPA